MTELRSNLNWAGYFRTMAERMSLCESEEQMYKQLRRFKEEDFMPEYGRLSRTKRRTKGFRWRDGLEGDTMNDRTHVYTYGMRLRGFSIGCQPKYGLVERRDDESGLYYDVLVYERKLTYREMEDYELDYIGEETWLR